MAAVRVLSPASRPCSTRPRRRSPCRWSEPLGDEVGLIISSLCYREKSPVQPTVKPSAEASPKRINSVEETPQLPPFLIVGKQHLLSTLPANRTSLSRQRRRTGTTLHPLLTGKVKSPPPKRPLVLLRPAFKVLPKAISKRPGTSLAKAPVQPSVDLEAVSGWEV